MGQTRAVSSLDLQARADHARDQTRSLVLHSRDLLRRMNASVDRLSRLAAELTNAYADAHRRHRIRPHEDVALSLVASVSHELRTPLAGIVGWLRILEQTDDASMRARALRHIGTSAERQQRLIENLLEAASLRSQNVALALTQFDAREPVQASLDALHPMLTEKAQAVELALEPATLLGDAMRLQQVTDNLLRNAIKFTPAGGRIEVAVHACERHVQITVCDDGKGIDKAFLPHVFESYRQAKHTEVRQGGGVGLGLAICKEIVELHGGTLEARSDGPGRGSCFQVRLPRGGPGLP